MSNKKNDGRGRSNALNMPNIQLFKPEGIIEGIIVGVSVLSGLILILYNIIGIEPTLKYAIPRFIANNFPQIMNVAHIALIVYALIAMSSMLELIKGIDLNKEKNKETSEKDKDTQTNSEDADLRYKRWSDWIMQNINIKLIDKKNKEYNIPERNINRNIRIANDNLRAFYIIWLIIWGGWLLLYCGMFISEFLPSQIKDPLESKYAINIYNNAAFVRDNTSDSLIYLKIEKLRNELNTSYNFVPGLTKDFILINPNKQYTVKELEFNDIVVFKDTINKSKISDNIQAIIPPILFFNWLNPKGKQKDYRVFVHQQDVSQKKEIISDTLCADISEAANAITTHYKKGKSGKLIELKTLFTDIPKQESKYLSVKGGSVEIGDYTEIKIDTLQSKTIMVHGMNKRFELKHYFIFIENTIGNFINLCFFILYYILAHHRVSMSTLKELSIDKSKDSYKKSWLSRFWFFVISKNSYKKSHKNFWMFVLIGILLNGVLIVYDFYVTVKGNDQSLIIKPQLIVSTLCCVSMLFMFGQLNTGSLRLPLIGIIVMYMYAAIQLFFPFSGHWVLSNQYISADSFRFFFLTFCFISKFMVFTIIRWLLKDGILAYYFFKETYESQNTYTGIFVK